MGPFVVAAVGAAVALAFDVQFLGAGECPAAAEVARAYAPLAETTPVPTDDPGVTVVIERRGHATVIRFAGTAADATTERELPAEMPCSERAKAAAVIVATHLETRPSAPATEETPTVVPTSPTALVTIHADRGTRSETDSVHAIASDEIDFGAQGGRAGSALAAGGRLGFIHTFANRDQLRGVAGAMGRERIAMAGGWATWTRMTLGLGYGRRFSLVGGTRFVFVDLGGDLLISRLALGSEGFLRPETNTTFHPGVEATARYGWRLSRYFGLWGATGATVWPRKQRVFLRDVTETATLPRLELVASVGVFFSLR